MIVLTLLAAIAVIIYFIDPFRRTLVTEDHNGDTKPDVWVHFTEAGQVARIERDDNFDGEIDRWFYVRGQDAQGQYLWEKTEAFLVDQDGKRHRTVTLFDEMGRQTRLEHDNDGDGKMDAVSLFTPPQSTPHRIEKDTDHNGFFETFLTYNPQGLRIKEEHDANGDGKVDRYALFRDGREPAYEIGEDRDFDGTFEIVQKEEGEAAPVKAINQK